MTNRRTDQVMWDATAQNLLARIVELHEQLCQRLTSAQAAAEDADAYGPGTSEAGTISGTRDYDEKMLRIIEARQRDADRAVAYWQRERKRRTQQLRRLIEDYEIGLGLREPRKGRGMVSIDYHHGGHHGGGVQAR